MNHTKKSYPSIILLLLVLFVPSGIALAGSGQQISLQAETPTVFPALTTIPTPTVLPALTSTPTKATAAESFFTEPIPGILQLDTIAAQFPDTTDLFTFEDFGLEEIALRGPFAAYGYYYDLPATWKMKQDATLRFVLDVFYTSILSESQAISPTTYGGNLLVQYNFTTIGAIDLGKEGRMQVDMPIPLEILNKLQSNKGQSIQLILDSDINCDVNFRTTVVVRSLSQLYLPHDLVAPALDLRSLPAPFYQNSFNQDTALIIVPDQPTADELQAALSVAAGFGRMTNNRLLISLMPISQVPADLIAETNLIFVGKAQGFPLLENESLPVPVLDGVLNAIDSNHGVAQMAVSPWNKNKVLLFVSGNNDQGVVNAAQGVSTGTLQVGANPSISLVSNVQLFTTTVNPTDVEKTFDDLGYDSVVVSEAGLNTVFYSFEIPPGYILGSDAYLDLNFSHTSLLEYQRSTIVVKLNDQPVGSVRLSDQTVGQGNAKILLPASAARPGSNSLRLDINLEPQNECVNPLLDGLWMRIDSSSALHLPLFPNPASPSILVDLGRYPSPFAFDPRMKDLAFVLAQDDPVSWNVAAQLAFAFGNTNLIQIAGLEAFYANSIPEPARQERNLIIIGKPSKLEILSELYSALPAPFEPGTDLAIEENLQVSYHLGPGADVGYLELLSAPWNSRQTILYVGGTSDLGVRWAGAALQLGRLRSKLSGNLAFINGEQIITADTRTFQGEGILATAFPANSTPSTVEIEPVIVDRPGWILLVIFTALGGIALVLIILSVQAIVRRRSGR